jgi:hypothetical protein
VSDGGAPGMRVSPDDPRLILLDDGTTVRTSSPVVELFLAGGAGYARTRPPGRTADMLHAVRSSRDAWRAVLLHDVRITIDGATLTTAGFTHTFRGRIVSVVQLTDGAFVAGCCASEDGLVALEPDGRVRWSRRFPDLWDVTRVDDRRFPDIVVVTASDFDFYLHPWDGHTIVEQWIK